jgi:hypothetical protein
MPLMAEMTGIEPDHEVPLRLAPVASGFGLAVAGELAGWVVSRG